MAAEKPAPAWPFLICLGTGVLGVASGFAVFFLFLEDQTPLKFFEILISATVLSFIIERLREIIDARSDEAHKTRGRWSSVLPSLLVVGLSELFALAWHALIGYGSQDFKVVEEIVTGGAFRSAHASRAEMLTLVAVWMVSGMALAGALSTGIERSSKPLNERIAGGAATGALIGGLFAPVVLLVMLIVFHVFNGLRVLIFAPDDWRANFHTLQHAVGVLGGVPGFVLRGVFWAADHVLYFLGDANTHGPLVVVALMIAGGLYGIRQKAGWLPWVVLVIAVVLVMAPLLPGIGGVFLLLVRTAIIWALPGVVLGGLVPLLERPSDVPRWWSVVAFAAAVVLIAITAVRFDGRLWPLLPAAGIVATGWFVWRTGSVEGCWPVLAVSVATIVCGLTITVQQFATFSGVLGTVYDLRHLPDRLAQIVPAQTTRTAGMFTLADYMQSSGTRSDQTAQTAEIDSVWLGRSKIRSAEEFIAKDLARVRAAEASLVKLSDVVTSIVGHGQRWTAALDELRAMMAKDQPTSVPASTDTVEGAEHSFRRRLKDVVTVQQRLATLDADVAKELSATRDLIDKVGTIHHAEDQDTVRVLATLDQSKLGEWQATQVRVWSRSQELLDRLTPYQRELEAVVGAPVNGGKASGLTVFKEDFSRVANDAYATVCRWLELGLAGSFGFWTTLGLLAGWSLHRRAMAE